MPKEEKTVDIDTSARLSDGFSYGIYVKRNQASQIYDLGINPTGFSRFSGNMDHRTIS